MTDPHPTRTAPPEDTGQTLTYPGAVGPVALPAAADRYDLGREIARGGMGIVYQATDTALAREVAVKTLRDELRVRPQSVRRFIEEAQISGRLQHPGIPPVYDLGTLPDGRLYLAMKLIEGRTFADVLADPAIDFAARRRVFEQVCQTVAYAHSRGIIHRD